MKQTNRISAASHADAAFPLSLGILLLLLFAASAAFAAVDRNASYPRDVPAGMEKIKSREFDKLYVKPGFRPGDYGKLIIEQPVVALDDQWEWNNRRQITQLDLDNMSSKTSKIMLEQFTEKLSDEAGFTVTVADSAAAVPPGAGVLRLKPSMIDISPNAPELKRDTYKKSYSRSAGFATLYLDLYDANTGELLMRVIDRDEPQNRQTLQQTNRGTNYHDTELMVSRWAKALREHLDDLNSGTG